MAHLLAEGDDTQHVFDEGNRPSVTAISELRDSVRNRLAVRNLILLTDDAPSGAIELESAATPLLQAADLAAGWARRIYLDRGVKGVSEQFKGVILNGSMVRST
jgi:hypothetical protein